MTYQDQIGREGETAVYNYLIAHNFAVEDVSDNPAYWSQDIDFIAQKGEKTALIEVKNDQHINRTGNAFIEHTQDIDKETDGWIKITSADELWYRDAWSGVVFVIMMDDLRAFIEANKDRLQQRKAKPNAVGKVSQGYLVPIVELEKYCEIERIQT